MGPGVKIDTEKKADSEFGRYSAAEPDSLVRSVCGETLGIGIRVMRKGRPDSSR